MIGQIIPVPNQKIFCNVPWYELQVYWDGSLGTCCQEDHKIFPAGEEEKYNIKNMSIKEWMDSHPMRQARMAMFGDSPVSFCRRCYNEEFHSQASRRIRGNQKSVIFTKSNFHESYLQSPGVGKFETTRQKQGLFDDMPIDLHIDLGNYCNLTCKMCNPRASSSIAVQHVKWGIQDAKQYVGSDWTRDVAVWDRVLNELASIKKLKNVHFMGGETLLTPRFEDFVDYMLKANRTDLNFSFVTNGTFFNERLMSKLRNFKRIGIEVSIETMTKHNEYQRQGTDNAVIYANIEKYKQICDDSNITLTIRPAISLLTIGYYHTLLEYCLQNRLVVKSLICTDPRYLDASILPMSIKEIYKIGFANLLKKINVSDDGIRDYNESDPNQINQIIRGEITRALSILSTAQPADSQQQLKHMVRWCNRWDKVHGYNAYDLYPEFKDILIEHGYET
jgi:sulfatase maturation enzyme AslB (radical SAM superfamily)